MAQSLNLSLIEGRLTRDPELFYTTSGHAICKFDVAVNFRMKSGEKDIEDVSFISVTSWSKVAESCSSYLKKGSRVRVKGRLKQDSWQAKDGTKRNKVYIEAQTVEFLWSKKSDNSEAEAETNPAMAV
jgi:single-strand DNA-binding protein